MEKQRGEIREYLVTHRERHVARIQKFLAQTSVAGGRRELKETADLLASSYSELGCSQVELVPNGGTPGVFAFYDAGSPLTIVNYCMFDTKVPRPDGWTVDPYEGTRVITEDHGECLYGLGAYSRKGPYIAWLNALEAHIAVARNLPVNILFLAEGEENIGSPHYRSMINQYRQQLSKAQACFSPGAAAKDNTLELRLGYKGLIVVQLTASGQAWGRGPFLRDDHGMAQGVVDSSGWRLVSALATLVEDGGRRVCVTGFDDQSRPPNEVDITAICSLIDQHASRPWYEVLDGIGGPPGQSSAELTEEEIYRRYYFEPSCNLHQISLGMHPTGAFLLPGSASASMDIRLPQGYESRGVVKALRRHLDAMGFPDVELEVLADHPAWSTDPESELVSAVNAACQRAGVSVSSQPYTAGGGPWTLFGTEFGMPVLFNVGIGQGARAGGPDEVMIIEEEGSGAGLIASELWYSDFLRAFADKMSIKA